MNRYVFVCHFFIVGRNKMHFMALLPMYKTAFLSCGINDDAYLAKGPLKLLTDRIQEPCTTASCLQGHVFLDI